MTENSYEQRLMARVDRIYPAAYERLADIQTFPEPMGEYILREILETGCLSQHAANIMAARKAIRQLPTSWLRDHLPKVVPQGLFQEREWQEWEFRRAAEMLQEGFPEAFAWLLDYAMNLRNPEVDEAVDDILE